MRRGVLLGLVVLVVAACGGADPDPAASATPTVDALEVVVSGEVATLVANVVDPDGELDIVIVEWGDGASDTVPSGFPGVRLDHTYTADGEFTIVLEARAGSGQSVIATTVASITAFAEAADASPATTDDDAGGEGSGTGGSGSSGGAAGGSTPPTPAPAPAPPPEPVPEEPEPEPIPEPVTLDLLDDEVVISLEASGPDGAGGSAEAVQQGPYAFGLRSYAWHGYNGVGQARGLLERAVDATSVLADMPEQVTAVTAEISYKLDVTAEVKGPNDRSSRFSVLVMLRPGASTRPIAEAVADSDDANPIKRVFEVGNTGTFTTTRTRDQPATAFVMEGRCNSRSGSQAVALLNEGYCDALEKGGITLRELSVTYTPIIED